MKSTLKGAGLFVLGVVVGALVILGLLWLGWSFGQ